MQILHFFLFEFPKFQIARKNYENLNSRKKYEIRKFVGSREVSNNRKSLIQIMYKLYQDDTYEDPTNRYNNRQTDRQTHTRTR